MPPPTMLPRFLMRLGRWSPRPAPCPARRHGEDEASPWSSGLSGGLIDGLPDGGVVDDGKAGGGGAGPGRNGREYLGDGRDASIEVGLEDGHAPPGEDDLDVAGHDTTLMTAPRPPVIRRRSGAYGLEWAGAVAARAAAAARARTAMIFFIQWLS